MEYDKDYENKVKDKWKKKYATNDVVRATYDGWFDDHLKEIEKCTDPIIDLGCGNGNNAYYLESLGHTVIACDYIKEALDSINTNRKNIITKCFDMRDGLPFKDNYTSIIIADLSLHYFQEKDTIKIIDDIKRVLKPNGMLLVRVNSINDVNFGSREGQEVEKNLRKTEIDEYKRFFDREDIDYFFKDFTFLYINEEQMNGRYERDKILWKLVFKLNK